MGATDYVEGNIENRLYTGFVTITLLSLRSMYLGFAWAHACVELICKLGLTRVFKFG